MLKVNGVAVSRIAFEEFHKEVSKGAMTPNDGKAGFSNEELNLVVGISSNVGVVMFDFFFIFMQLQVSEQPANMELS